MPRDNFTLEKLASEISRCVRRSPEFRMPPGRPLELGPLKLLGIVDGYAVHRNIRGAAPSTTPLKEFDQWQLTDKEGKPINAD